MSHLGGTWGNAIIVFNHTIVQLWRHSNNHMVKVWVEESTFWDIMAEWWTIVIACHQVVDVVDHTRLVWIGFWKLWRPHTLISTFGLMNSEIRGPDSIMNNSLSEVPFLEVVASVFLMSGMDSGSEDHLWDEFSLFESLVHEKIIFLMHGTMATLAWSLKHLEASSQSNYK